MTISIVVCATIGSVMKKNDLNGPAPSISAASYNSLDTPSIADKYKMSGWPTIHVTTTKDNAITAAHGVSNTLRAPKPSNSDKYLIIPKLGLYIQLQINERTTGVLTTGK
jgi:hypothetical protein